MLESDIFGRKNQYKESDIRDEYAYLTKLLIKNNLTITTMESATSGQIASLITDTEGASAIFKGAFITYSNEAKIMQGVDEEIINKYSVYSKETAIAMASSCRKAYGADIGIGVTGTTGNIDELNAESSKPGQIYFAIAMADGVRAFFVELAPQPSRLFYKLAVAKEVYDELIKLVKN